MRPTFLDRIDDPGRMVTYLQDLCWSDVTRCGVDNRKELNLAISVIARLVLQGGQAGYLSGPGFRTRVRAVSPGLARPGNRLFRDDLHHRQPRKSGQNDRS
jgi:hypothetical protein